MTEVERLNKWLETQDESLEGKVLYRIVWSNKVFENRFGTFRDFTESGLFLREVTEVRYVRKYNYINERWILEKWAPGNLTANRETPDSMNGDYIPVYVFEDKKGKYLPPSRKVLEFILNFMKGNIQKDNIPTQEYLDEKEIENQVDSMLDAPDFRTYGPMRDSVAYDKGLKNVT